MSPLWLTPQYYSLLFCVQKNKNRPDWDRIYEKSKALSRTGNPVKTPLLALPYGKPPLPSECSVIINRVLPSIYIRHVGPTNLQYRVDVVMGGI